MSAKTSIEWTDATWNPVRGCSIVSPGCRNCYAMRQAHRHAGRGGAYQGLTRMTKRGPVWTGKVRTPRGVLELPLHWRKPRRIFVDSMSDLFHERVPADYIARVFAVMATAKHHTFQILTKRAERMQQLLAHDLPYEGPEWPLPNVWIGVSVEDQKRADERIPLLLETPAAVRSISAEPLLGQVDLQLGQWVRMFSGRFDDKPCPQIDWVVAGGESGPKARPMHPAWARSLRDQCAAAGVPFLFKQWGAWAHLEQVPMDTWAKTRTYTRLGDVVLWRASKKLNGRFLDGRTHDGYPA